MTYAYNHVVLSAFLKAHAQGKRFKVVVVDAGPQYEGRTFAKKLLAAGLGCWLIHINAISFMISQVTKVFLGASAILSNGVVISRAGTAAVALIASSRNIPVIVCCETYKFNERVQLDSITSNELGNPEGIACSWDGSLKPHMGGWQEQGNMHLLNLVYDVTPADFVTMIVTEVGMVPPSSVPVILREYMRDTKGL
uniref:Translation initiation factor eIF2B subunit delta n=1 Tax=Tetraselmis sp. GSL018 TaxID=582737 RepID=A0A061SEY4_9CHLO